MYPIHSLPLCTAMNGRLEMEGFAMNRCLNTRTLSEFSRGLKKTMKKLDQNNPSPDQGSNGAPLEYKSERHL
jgi:hypothetical protein